MDLISFCCELDFFFGGHAAEGDAQGGMCQFVVAAERAQDVAGFERGGGAGGAAGYGEFFHCHNQAFAFDEVEADVQVVRGAVFEVAVDIDFFDAFDTFEEDIAQFQVVCSVLCQFFFGMRKASPMPTI